MVRVSTKETKVRQPARTPDEAAARSGSIVIEKSDKLQLMAESVLRSH
jgi:hypothetical protein